MTFNSFEQNTLFTDKKVWRCWFAAFEGAVNVWRQAIRLTTSLYPKIKSKLFLCDDVYLALKSLQALRGCEIQAIFVEMS